MKKQPKKERLYYLDLLRVFAVLLLIPFHTSMIFVHSGFHIKNSVTSTGLTIISAFIDNWHMPLFFLLAGASTYFALNKRSPGEYIKERLLRLIVPLVFGMVVIVPPQTFYERIQKSEFQGNYFDFYSHLFNGIYPEGNLTWNHLWFLFYLFIISIFILPAILSLKLGKRSSQIERLNVWLAEGHRIFILVIPLAIIQMGLKVAFPGPQNVISDWARVLFMLFIFLYGAMFCMYTGYRESFERNMGIAFVIGVVILLFFVILQFTAFRFTFGYNLPNLIQLGIKSLATLCWLIVLLGLSQRITSFKNRFIKYANEAVLPFYILHQTVIIISGFYVVKTNYSLMAKFIFINILSFILTFAIYDIIVKRFGLIRFLFGMRQRERNA